MEGSCKLDLSSFLFLSLSHFLIISGSPCLMFGSGIGSVNVGRLGIEFSIVIALMFPWYNQKVVRQSYDKVMR